MCDYGLPQRGIAMSNAKRAALYVRVSTDRQTVDNQIAALTKIAEARSWQIVATFSDKGISGAKTREDRPGLAKSQCGPYRASPSPCPR